MDAEDPGLSTSVEQRGWARMLERIWSACGEGPAPEADITGDAVLPGIFHCADLACASLAAAALAAAELVDVRWGFRPGVQVDRRLACLWFESSVRPLGWVPPAIWDPLAGDYRARDGWIKLHTNAATHRRAALEVLDCAQERSAVAAAVARRDGEELEAAIVAAGGAAARMRSVEEWDRHPQGRAVAREALVARTRGSHAPGAPLLVRPSRPLAGTRVLDLTRVLAGPVATRFLAGLGAEVLRIDPPGWDEPALVAETTLGKCCATLDLGTPAGRAKLLALASDADILVHGYRPGALAALGLGEELLEQHSPGLVQVTLDAYGWSGPWRGRRGYDSLVQMSCGIFEAGLAASAGEVPVHLPVQALDHATGYIMACAALRGLTRRLRTGSGEKARASLAATARLLTHDGNTEQPGPLAAARPDDHGPAVEPTVHGPALRLRPPLAITNVDFGWTRPALGVGSGRCAWRRP